MGPEEILPMPHHGLHLPFGKPNILFVPSLPLSWRESSDLLFTVNRDKHLLDARQIRREILLKAASDEGAGGVLAREEMVAPTGAVHHRVGGDIEDRPIDGEVDRERRVAAVVEGELGGCEVEGTFLSQR